MFVTKGELIDTLERCRDLEARVSDIERDVMGVGKVIGRSHIESIQRLSATSSDTVEVLSMLLEYLELKRMSRSSEILVKKEK